MFSMPFKILAICCSCFNIFALNELSDQSLRASAEELEKSSSIFGPDTELKVEIIHMPILGGNRMEESVTASVLCALGAGRVGDDLIGKPIDPSILFTFFDHSNKQFFCPKLDSCSNMALEQISYKLPPFGKRLCVYLAQNFLKKCVQPELLLLYLYSTCADPLFRRALRREYKEVFKISQNAQSAKVFDQTLHPNFQDKPLVFCACPDTVYFNSLDHGQSSKLQQTPRELKRDLRAMFSEEDLKKSPLKMLIIFLIPVLSDHDQMEHRGLLAEVTCSPLAGNTSAHPYVHVTIYDPCAPKQGAHPYNIRCADAFIAHLLILLEAMNWQASCIGHTSQGRPLVEMDNEKLENLQSADGAAVIAHNIIDQASPFLPCSLPSIHRLTSRNLARTRSLLVPGVETRNALLKRQVIFSAKFLKGVSKK